MGTVSMAVNRRLLVDFGAYVYARLSPVLFSDGSGLQPTLGFTTICCQNPVQGTNGADYCNPLYHQWVTWTVTNGSTFNGWIIQYINGSGTLTKYGDPIKCTNGNKENLGPDIFWEAWQVKNGKPCLGTHCTATSGKTDFPCGNLFKSCGAVDFWVYAGDMDCSDGNWTVTGLAKLFTNEQVQSDPPSSWGGACGKWGNPCILCTDKKPSYFDTSGSSPTPRTWTVNWTCCPTKGGTSSSNCSQPKKGNNECTCTNLIVG